MNDLVQLHINEVISLKEILDVAGLDIQTLDPSKLIFKIQNIVDNVTGKTTSLKCIRYDYDSISSFQLYLDDEVNSLKEILDAVGLDFETLNPSKLTFEIKKITEGPILVQFVSYAYEGNYEESGSHLGQIDL